MTTGWYSTELGMLAGCTLAAVTAWILTRKTPDLDRAASKHDEQKWNPDPLYDFDLVSARLCYHGIKYHDEFIGYRNDSKSPIC